MKKIIFILFLNFSCPFLVFSQGESNTWYFGYEAALSFNPNGSITQFGDNVMNATEGSATAADSKGNLLFYTDGGTVYDRTHNIMANGTGLTTNPTGTQTALIIPDPGDDNLYYIFSVDATTNSVRGTGLNYAIVDIRLNNGNGAVVNKNVNLLEDCAEKITAVIRDCETRSLWVIAQATETGDRIPQSTTIFPNFNTLHAFEVTPTGVSNVSVKSTFNAETILDDRGYIKVSPDKTKLASANMRDGLLVYDFDVATGVFSNQERIHMSGPNFAPYGVEFSPNSRYLYVHASNDRSAFDGHTSDLLQYDMTVANITNSRILLDASDVYRGALQLANNDRIYRALSVNFETGLPFLGIINNPDLPGLASNYEHQGLILTAGLSSAGLPPMVLSFYDNIDLLPADEENENTTELVICEGDDLLIEVPEVLGATYIWEKDNVIFNNPDRNILRIDEPTSSDEGVYRVLLERPHEMECIAIGEITVSIAEVPIADSLTLLICDNDLTNSEDGITTINLHDIETDENSTYTYFLSAEDLANDIRIEFPEEFVNTLPFGQSVFFEITNEAGCSANGEVFIQIEPRPAITLEETYIICIDDPNLSITAPENFDAYRWFRVEENSRILVAETEEFNVDEPGDYILEAINTFSLDGNTVDCISVANFEVLPSNAALIDDIIVNGNMVEVIVIGEGDYEFSLDGLTYQDENVLQVLTPGEVNIFVRDKNGCGIIQEIIEQDMTIGRFPNFFTPNGDGTNDYWQYIPPIVVGDVELEVIQIFSRFGNALAQIDPKSSGWNGTYNGKPLPTSDYWFKAIFSDKSIMTGNISLKR